MERKRNGREGDGERKEASGSRAGGCRGGAALRPAPRPVGKWPKAPPQAKRVKREPVDEPEPNRGMNFACPTVEMLPANRQLAALQEAHPDMCFVYARTRALYA